jgi:hypothetical protein
MEEEVIRVTKQFTYVIMIFSIIGLLDSLYLNFLASKPFFFKQLCSNNNLDGYIIRACGGNIYYYGIVYYSFTLILSLIYIKILIKIYSLW